MASESDSRPARVPVRQAATLVIGSGISGLFVALEARKLGPVIVLTKGSIDDCNTRWAQGGIAAAVGPLDSPEQHLRDTIAAGAGLVDEAAAKVLCSEAPERIRDLVEYGVAFDSIEGEVALGREAAHSRSRILHAGGDRTGAQIEGALAEAVSSTSITILDHTLVTGLTVIGDRVVGASAIDLRTGEQEKYRADATVLATGGAGQLYSHTTNPEVATGDGIALAFEAGAEVADLEFYQFHPTALRMAGAAPFLISEAVRGEGAVLRNGRGEAFMTRYHALADLAPRDVVARAIAREMRAEGGDHVTLDCTEIATRLDLVARFPGIFAHCLGLGIDIRRQPVPVAPAAHYYMGGVRTDTYGRTTLAGLYACGEVACTGVHGANRLASNSLMETVVFGKRVVEHLAGGAAGHAALSKDAARLALNCGAGIAPGDLRGLMWRAAGIERDGDGLASALAMIERPAGEQRSPADIRADHEHRQMGCVARLAVTAALRRTESRGAHFRTDFPEHDDAHWLRRQVFVRAD